MVEVKKTNSHRDRRIGGLRKEEKIKVNAAQIRLERREASRLEMVPSKRWQAFQEQRRHEDAAAMRFVAKQKLDAVWEKEATEPKLKYVLQRLRRGLDRYVRAKGGTDHAVLQDALVEWKGGKIPVHEFRKVLRLKLNLNLDDNDVDVLIGRYGGPLSYDEFLGDVDRFVKNDVLAHPDPRDVVKSLGETPRMPKKFSPLVRRFIKKLRRKLAGMILKSGEYERIIIRRAFLNWDTDASGRLNEDELIGAMRELGMLLSKVESREIVQAFGELSGNEFSYQPLVEVVCEDVPHFKDIVSNVNTELDSNLRGSGA